MNLHERERLIIGVVIALVIHAAVILGIEFAGLRPAPYSEITPMFVELLEYTLPEFPPEVEPEEPEPVDETPIEPEPVEPELVEPPPIEEPPDQPVPEPTTQPVPETPATTPAQRPSTNATTAPLAVSDVPTYVDEPLEGVPDPDALSETAAGRQRPTTENLFEFNQEPTEAGTVPQAVLDVWESIKPEASLDEATRAAIVEKSELDEGFLDRLNQVFRELNNPSRSSSNTSSTSGRTDPNATTDTDSLPGNSRLDWGRQAVRGPIGELEVPTLSASDFGGLVPAETEVIVFFDVNEDGQVVPGSIFVPQSSGHLAVDGKILDTVRRWRFEPKSGADVVAVICTLILERH